IYPVWEKLKLIKGIKVSLKGITAAAGGLIAAAGVILMHKNGWSLLNLTVVLITVGLLLTKKIPTPLIVAAALAAGFLL
ncbi:MAG: chromate transporter, partial [Clostridiales bacterium]|nr:chromate transporter [Clostridiales bacterium]